MRICFRQLVRLECYSDQEEDAEPQYHMVSPSETLTARLSECEGVLYFKKFSAFAEVPEFWYDRLPIFSLSDLQVSNN